MKSLIAFVVGVALLLSAAAAMSQEPAAPAAGAKRAAAQPKGMMVQMDEQMKKMQALHDRMIAATTAAERQQSMEDARKEMQAAMVIMKPATRGAGGNPDGLPPEVMDSVGKGKRGGHGKDQMTGRRIDMLQMMIQLMMDQQAMMSAPKDGGTPKKK